MASTPRPPDQPSSTTSPPSPFQNVSSLNDFKEPVIILPQVDGLRLAGDDGAHIRVLRMVVELAYSDPTGPRVTLEDREGQVCGLSFKAPLSTHFARFSAAKTPGSSTWELKIGLTKKGRKSIAAFFKSGFIDPELLPKHAPAVLPPRTTSEKAIIPDSPMLQRDIEIGESDDSGTDSSDSDAGRPIPKRKKKPNKTTNKTSKGAFPSSSSSTTSSVSSSRRHHHGHHHHGHVHHRSRHHHNHDTSNPQPPSAEPSSNTQPSTTSSSSARDPDSVEDDIPKPKLIPRGSLPSPNLSADELETLKARKERFVPRSLPMCSTSLVAVGIVSEQAANATALLLNTILALSGGTIVPPLHNFINALPTHCDDADWVHAVYPIPRAGIHRDEAFVLRQTELPLWQLNLLHNETANSVPLAETPSALKELLEKLSSELNAAAVSEQGAKLIADNRQELVQAERRQSRLDLLGVIGVLVTVAGFAAMAVSPIVGIFTAAVGFITLIGVAATSGRTPPSQGPLEDLFDTTLQHVADWANSPNASPSVLHLTSEHSGIWSIADVRGWMGVAGEGLGQERPWWEGVQLVGGNPRGILDAILITLSTKRREKLPPPTPPPVSTPRSPPSPLLEPNLQEPVALIPSTPLASDS